MKHTTRKSLDQYRWMSAIDRDRNLGSVSNGRDQQMELSNVRMLNDKLIKLPQARVNEGMRGSFVRVAFTCGYSMASILFSYRCQSPNEMQETLEEHF